MIKKITMKNYLNVSLKIIFIPFFSLASLNNISLRSQTLELPEIVSGEVLESITGSTVTVSYTHLTLPTIVSV